MEQNSIFKTKRFGLFIHWGIYAILGRHEQILWRWNLKREEYEYNSKIFNPVKFNPGLWIDVLKSAGMDYMCFTVKHHDGFCMWDTACTDYNVTNTPYGKDVFRLLYKECEKADIPLGIYYSCVDWHHPCYPNLGRSHELIAPRPTDTPDIEKYYEYVKNQMTELCTQYGKIYQLFWDLNIAEYYNPKINKHIKNLQPDIIINDRGPGKGDYITKERDMSESIETGYPVEACQSVGSSGWGYRRDEDYFSIKYIMRSVDRVLSTGANYILNVGPDALGLFPKPAVKILKKVGDWFNRVKDSYYGKKPVSFENHSEYIFTYTNNILFVHINKELKTNSIVLDFIDQYPMEVMLLNNNMHLPYVVDILPYRQDRGPCLRIRNVPVDDYANEILVIKIIFDCDVKNISK